MEFVGTDFLFGNHFIYHTYGLGLDGKLRHAPWSNGYEALTFIAWGSVLAGMFFIRNLKLRYCTSHWLFSF